MIHFLSNEVLFIKWLNSDTYQRWGKEVKVAVFNAKSQNYNFFEVKLVSYASLCLEKYLDQFFMKLWVDVWPFYLTELDELSCTKL